MITWRNDFQAWARSNVGRIWYCWDTQDLDAGLADCSGLVIEGLKLWGRLPLLDARGKAWDNNAQGLADHFQTPAGENPEPGDLVFYGADWAHVQHVAFYFGELEITTRDEQDQPKTITWPRAVCGMWGGDSTVKGELGRLMGAGFWFKERPDWWRRYLGIRKVP